MNYEKKDIIPKYSTLYHKLHTHSICNLLSYFLKIKEKKNKIIFTIIIFKVL